MLVGKAQVSVLPASSFKASCLIAVFPVKYYTLLNRDFTFGYISVSMEMGIAAKELCSIHLVIIYFIHYIFFYCFIQMHLILVKVQ